MAKFSIKDIEAVSGIKSHTLRIWEQRYGIIKPKRTDTNIRYYDDNDLKLILNISILNGHGYRISEIAAMSPELLHTKVLELTDKGRQYDGVIKSLVSVMLTLDEYSFNKVLSTSILQSGLENTMLNVIFPFLQEVGLLWQIGSIHTAHEHFISNLIKQKLYVAIDGQGGESRPGKKKFLLFLKENEPHEFGLLFANYMLKARGHEVIYLGKNLPHAELRGVFDLFKPNFVVTSITTALMPRELEDFIENISTLWPEATILISGKQVEACRDHLPSNVKIVNDINYFKMLVDELSRDAFNN